MKPNDFLFPVEKKIYIKHSGSKHFLFSWADFFNYNFKKMILALFLCVKLTEFFYLFFLHIWNQTGNKDYQKSPGRKHECFESHWCTSASCGHKECHQNKHGKIIISEIAKTLCVCVSFCLWVTDWNKPFSHSVSDREKKKNSHGKKQQKNKHFSLHVFTEKRIKKLFSHQFSSLKCSRWNYLDPT